MTVKEVPERNCETCKFQEDDFCKRKRKPVSEVGDQHTPLSSESIFREHVIVTREDGIWVVQRGFTAFVP